MSSYPAIIAHLHWINGFHTAYWNKHYVWLTAVDETSGKASFRTHHMATRTLIMGKELHELAGTWRFMPSFQGYLKAKKMVNDAMENQCLNVLEKQFLS